MSIRPTLNSLVIATLGGEIIDDFIYEDGNGVKWVVLAVSCLDSLYDKVVVTTLNGTAFTELRGPASSYGLTKYQRYTFANHAGRCYVANYADPTWWFDTSFTASTYDPAIHDVKNAPLCQYLFGSKSRLFAGKLRDYIFPATHITATGDASTTDGAQELTSDGAPGFISASGIKTVLAGDQLAFCNYSVVSHTITHLGTTLTFNTSDQTTWFAKDDYVAFEDEQYLHWYKISATVTYNAGGSGNTVITLETPYRGKALSNAATGVVVMGGALTATAGKKTSTWLTIEQVISSTVLKVRTALDYENAAQYFILKRNKNNVVAWSALEMTNDWEECGVDGDETNGFQEIEQEVTGLSSFGNTTLIFTEDTVRALMGTTMEDWFLSNKTKSDIGCSSHWSIVSKDKWVAFWSKKNGVYFLQGGQIANTSEFFNLSSLASESASDLIKGYVNKIDKDLATQVRSYIHKDLLVLSVPNSENHTKTYTTGTCLFTNADTTVTGTDTVFLGNVKPGDYIKPLSGATYYEVASVTSSTVLVLTTAFADTTTASVVYEVKKRRNNDLLILDTKVSASSSNYIGWTVGENFFANSFINTGTKTYYGSSYNGYLYEFDVGGELFGKAITSTFQTPVWDGGAPQFTKVFDRLEVTAKGNQTIQITPIVDGVYKTSVSYTWTSVNNMETVTFPRFVNGNYNPFNSKGKSIQLEISSTGTGTNTIVGLNIYGNVITY